MVRHEFDEACKKCCSSYDPATVSSDMYSVIEYVYMWYPTISNSNGKNEIAYLYTTFGWGIIQDMYARAHEACKIEEHIREANNDLQKLLEQRDMLIRGDNYRSRVDKFEYPGLEEE